MSTTHNSLSLVIFNKTRRAILALLYIHPEKVFHMRSIVRATNAGHGSVQRELKLLTESGILRRSARGHQVFYQANEKCIIYKELKSIITKTFGISDILRDALLILKMKIEIAFIYGSIASGEEDQESDIDLLVAGNVMFAEVVKALHGVQEILGREVNPTVYTMAEFYDRIKEGHYFIQNVLDSPKVFIYGDNDELNGLVKSRVAEGTQAEAA